MSVAQCFLPLTIHLSIEQAENLFLEKISVVIAFADRGCEGKIIAESKVEELDSLLGMTYPAADIPPQARALFLRNRVSAIADTSYVPVPLLSEAGCVGHEPIATRDRHLQHAPHGFLMRMRRPDEIHRHVRIDEDRVLRLEQFPAHHAPEPGD